jgi:sodium/potassium/calcium exchanger 6
LLITYPEPAEQTPLLQHNGLSISTPNLRAETHGTLENFRLHHSMRDVTRQTPLTRLPSFSLIGALEFRQVITSLQRESATSALSPFELPISPFAAGHYHPHPHPQLRTPPQDLVMLPSPRTPLPPDRTRHDGETDPWDATLGLPLSERRELSPEAHPQVPLLSKLQAPEVRLETPSESYSPTPSEFMGSRPRNAHSFLRPSTKFHTTMHAIRQILHILSQPPPS